MNRRIPLAIALLLATVLPLGGCGGRPRGARLPDRGRCVTAWSPEFTVRALRAGLG